MAQSPFPRDLLAKAVSGKLAVYARFDVIATTASGRVRTGQGDRRHWAAS